MYLLKRENWWIWLLLTFFSGGTGFIALGALLNVYKKNNWYAKRKNWLIALLCLIFPFLIMMIVFQIQILCETNAKLNTPGKEIYLSPYIWLFYLIVPFIGWIIFIIQLVYLIIWPLVMLHKGNGEKYI